MMLIIIITLMMMVAVLRTALALAVMVMAAAARRIRLSQNELFITWVVLWSERWPHLPAPWGCSALL